MIYDMIIEFIGQAPENYEYLTYIFAGFVLLLLIAILVIFITMIIYSFVTFFSGGGDRL